MQIIINSKHISYFLFGIYGYRWALADLGEWTRTTEAAVYSYIFIKPIFFGNLFHFIFRFQVIKYLSPF